MSETNSADARSAGISHDGRVVTSAEPRTQRDDEFYEHWLGGVDEALAAEIGAAWVNEARVKAALVEASQRRIAEATSRLAFAANDVMGGMRLDAVVSRESWDYWCARQSDLGDNPWLFDEFWEEYKRDNPEGRVKETARRVCVTVEGEFTKEGEA